MYSFISKNMSYVCLIFVFSCRLISRVYEFLYISSSFRVFRVSKYYPLNIFIFKHYSFLIGCIVCQQTQETATQIEEHEMQDLEQTTDSFEYYGQALQQSMLQVPAVDFGSYGYGTFAAGTHCTTPMGTQWGQSCQPQLNPYQR